MMLLIILIIFAVIIISPITINIKMLKDNNNDEVIINFKLLYGIIKFKLEYPLINIEVNKKNINLKFKEERKSKIKSNLSKDNKQSINIDKLMSQLNSAKGIFNEYKDILNYILSRINWKLLYWISEIGTNNAASTGLITGLISIIKSNLVVFMNNRNYEFEKVRMDTAPNFKKLVFRTKLNCIFSIKVGYIIIAGLKFLKLRFIS